MMQDEKEHYEEVLTHVDMLKNHYSKGLFIVGDAGIGKTTQITQALEGTKYIKIGGHLSPLKLYKLLFMYNDDYIIFMDDTDSMLKDKKCEIILKQALDTTEPRKIGWDSSTGLLHGFPSSFDFNSRIIFCLNEIPQDEGFKTIMDRVSAVFLNFNTTDRFDVMYKIATKERKIGSYIIKPETRREIVDFIKDNMDVMNVGNISLRTQNKVENYYVYGMESKKDWKHLALNLLSRR
jgi:hypothetical protein